VAKQAHAPHAAPNQEGAAPDIDLAVIAITPARADRRRSRLSRWLVAHQGWYFFPTLLLEGLSLDADWLIRLLGRDKLKRRWVEFTLLVL